MPEKKQEVTTAHEVAPDITITPNAKAVEVMAENLAGGGISVADLPTATVPGGKSRRWAGLDGEPTAITGVVIGWRRARAYWVDAFGEGSRGPSCTSIDGLNGKGTPGGACLVCPLSAFGSRTDPDTGERSDAPACREFRQLLVLEPSKILPTVVRIPPTSIRAWNRYVVALTATGDGYWETLTTMSLSTGVSVSGHDYPEVVFGGEKLKDPLALEMIREFREALSIDWTPPADLADIEG